MKRFLLLTVGVIYNYLAALSIDCQVKTPSVIAPSSLCTNSALPTLKPSSGGLDNGLSTSDGSYFKYYIDSQTGTSPVKGSINQDLTISLPVDNNGQIQIVDESQTFIIKVTEYDAILKCESPEPAIITLVVNAAPSAPILNNQNSCQFATLNSVRADTIVNWYWTKTETNIADAIGIEVTPAISGDLTGIYPFWARKTNSKGCTSAATEGFYTVKPQPEKVTFTGKMEVCSNALPFVMTVNGTSVAALRDNSGQSMQEANQYQVTVNDFDGLNAKVSFTQTIDGCTSTPELLPTKLVKSPTNTFMSLGISSCEGGAMVTMKAEGNPSAWENVLWYLQPNQTDASAALQQGQKYKPWPLTTTTSFYVHEYAKGQIEECHGPDSQIEYTIYAQPASPTIIEPTKTFYCQNDSAGISQLVLTAKSNEYDANNNLTPGTYVWKRNGVIDQTTTTDKFPVSYINSTETTISVQFVIKTLGGAMCLSESASLDLKTVASPSIEYIYNTYDSVQFPNRINVCQDNKVELKARCYRTTDLTWTIINNTITPAQSKNYYTDGLMPVEFDAAAEGYVPGVNYPLVLTVAHTFSADVNGKTKSVDCKDAEQGYLRIIKTPKVEIIGSTKTCESLIKDYRYTAKVLEGHVDSLVWPDPKKIKWTSAYDKTKDPLVQEIGVLWQEPKIDTITLKAFDRTWGCYGETALPVQIARNPNIQFTYDILGTSTEVRFINETSQDPVTGTQYDLLTKKFVPVSYPVTCTYLWDFGRETDKDWVTYTQATDSTQRISKDVTKQNIQTYTNEPKTVTLQVKNNYGCSINKSIDVSSSHQLPVSYINNSDEIVKLFPNPTKGNFTVQIPGTKANTAIMRIITTNGEIETLPIVIIDNVAYITEQLPVGVYTIEIFTDQKAYSTQLLIE